MLWDKEREGCILEYFSALVRRIRYAVREGFRFWGLLAAPPCTHFAGSGARWWKEKDATPPVREEIGGEVWSDPWNIVDYAKAYVLIVLHLVELFRPRRFWVLEQPVGRIETLIPEMMRYRAMTFNPCDYGDPYTKRTVLYGRFNTALPRRPALCVIPDYIHKMPPSPERAMKRSVTPMGFANAFFAAN